MLCKVCGNIIYKNESYLYRNTHLHLDCIQTLTNSKVTVKNAWKREQDYSELEWDFDELIQFLMQRYDGYNPKFAKKVSEVVCGERKNCPKIPAKALLEMWIQLVTYLDKCSGGIKDLEHKFNYDLVVVLGSYAKYLGWKRKRVEIKTVMNCPIDLKISEKLINKATKKEVKEELDLNEFI